MANISAFLLAGTASGSGKTTITLGIMAALKERGLAVQPYKCGPDFIDPTLHSMVTGEISSNLDLRMCGKEFCENIFAKRLIDKDVGIVEGVMGLFDGGEASSASLALALNIPVILVVDARSAAESVAAVVKGFESFLPGLQLAGVIFNRVGSTRHKELIVSAMKGNCRSRILGFFPRDQRFEIPDRHLGLVMGQEKPLQDDKLKELIAQVEQYIDLDQLLDMGTGKKTPTATITSPPMPISTKMKIAVAKDEAFCFYYQDNFDILINYGAELCFFSPLHDEHLPEGCRGIYLGGGYPELHGEKLSGNQSILRELYAFADNDGVIYGECGGFMYLCQTLTDLEGSSHTMSEIFPLNVRMRPRLSRLGYREVVLEKECCLGKKGQKLYGHEFHYSEIVPGSESGSTCYLLNSNAKEGYMQKNVLGSYVHLHFGKNPDTAGYLIEKMAQSPAQT